MQDYFAIFSLVHQDFRLPELFSVCRVLAVTVELPLQENGEEQPVDRAVMIIRFEDDEQARKVAARCLLMKSIHRLWADGKTYEELHERNAKSKSLWECHMHDTFKFDVSASHHTIPQARATTTINGFRYMDFKGKVNLKSPQLVMTVFEEYSAPTDPYRNRSDGDSNFLIAYVGRFVAPGGAALGLVAKFDVKKRLYYGTTSMEAEMSLLMANQALAGPGKLVYDPFVGTGSMLYTAAFFGAFVMGSDIDGRQMRGKGSGSPTMLDSANQYDVSKRFLDCLTFDVTQHPWRTDGVFDAIVTDPPYGVRAGAKRLGGRKDRPALRDGPIILDDGVEAHTKSTYVPPTVAYELSELVHDLVMFSRRMLVNGGRLVFFLPTVTDEYQEVDIPAIDGMRLVSNSLQDFGKWGRRLITIERDDTHVVEEGGAMNLEPAHKDFRSRYFTRFVPQKSKDTEHSES